MKEREHSLSFSPSLFYYAISYGLSSLIFYSVISLLTAKQMYESLLSLFSFTMNMTHFKAEARQSINSKMTAGDK